MHIGVCVRWSWDYYNENLTFSVMWKTQQDIAVFMSIAFLNYLQNFCGDRMLGRLDLDCTLISDRKNASFLDIKQKKYHFSSIRPELVLCFFKEK